jgi:3-hydroxybutyryl-CoA dehydratase
VKRVDDRRDQVTIAVEGNSLSGDRLLEAELIVETPEKFIIPHQETVE